MDTTLTAAVIALAGALVALAVSELLTSKRLREGLRHDRRLRLRDDRRALYRETLEVSYAIVNAMQRAANWAAAEEIAESRGYELAEGAAEEAWGQSGKLTDQALEKLDILQARVREIKILGGEGVYQAAFALVTSVGDLWNALPDPTGRPVSREQFGKLAQATEEKICLFVDEIEEQLSLD